MQKTCKCGVDLTIRGTVRRDIYNHGYETPPHPIFGHVVDGDYFPDEPFHENTARAAASAYYSEDRCHACGYVLRKGKQVV